MSAQKQVSKSEQSQGHTAQVQKADAELVREESERQDAKRAAAERELAAKVMESAAEKIYSIDAVLSANVGFCALTEVHAA